MKRFAQAAVAGCALLMFATYAGASGNVPAAQKMYCVGDATSYSDEDVKECFDFLHTATPSRDDRITGWTNLGYIHNFRHEYAQGIEAADKAIAIDPSYYRAYIVRGTSYRALAKFDLVLADLNKAVELAPTRAVVFQARGSFYLQTHKNQDARDDFSKALALNSRNIYALENRVRAEMALHDSAAALADANTDVSINPDRANAYYFRAKFYESIGKLLLAAGDFGNTLSAHPAAYLEGLAKGDVAFDRGDNAGAIAGYSQAILARQNSAYALMIRGRAYEALGQYDKALADMNAAIALDPNDAAWLNDRSMLHTNMADYQHAIADADQVVSLVPKSGYAWNAACWTRSLANAELDKALTDCERALTLNPNNADDLDSLGFVQFRRRDMKAALVAYNAAIVANPHEASSLYMRGYIERDSGETARATTDIAAAKAIDPKIADMYAKHGVK